MFPPKLSLVPNADEDHSAIEEFADIRLTASERRLVRRLLKVSKQHLGVDGLMFAAGGFEDAAMHKRAEKLRRKHG
jgi:hypothetical protein